MIKKAFVAMCALMAALCAVAQADVADSARWDYHLSVGMGVAAGGGTAWGYSWVAPSAVYHASDRLTLGGGFAAVGTLMGGHRLQGLGDRSLAPRRQGTRMVTGHVEAEYRVSERLTVWASLLHAGGQMLPWWDPAGEPRPVDATAFSGGFNYQLWHNATVEMHFTVVRDRAGSLWPMMPLGDPMEHCSLLEPWPYGTPCF